MPEARAGHDPIRVGAGVRARGLTPNIHHHLRQSRIARISASARGPSELGIENVFAITGDYPQDRLTRPRQPVLRSGFGPARGVDQRTARRTGLPFYISAAVSPFKYTEADCAYQYLKLEKKIAAGADYAITQLGYDARKFRELKRYLDERGLQTPVFGNVYILPGRRAEKFSKGEPPGCWVSPELVERIQAETQGFDRQRAGRAAGAGGANGGDCARAGICGSVSGRRPQRGPHSLDHPALRRVASRWEELAEEISYAPKGGFYFYDSPPNRPKPMRPLFRFFDVMAGLFPVKHEDNWLRRFLAAIMRWWTEVRRRRARLRSWKCRSRNPCSDARRAATAFWARWNTSAR